MIYVIYKLCFELVRRPIIIH